MEKFVIQGGKSLKGEIKVFGAKNSATPILSAAIIAKTPSVIHNVPNIGDVRKILKIFKSAGVRIGWLDAHTVKIEPSSLDPGKIDKNLVCEMRSSSYLLGTMLVQTGELTIPLPGGCNIGARPMDTHFLALQELGMKIKKEGAEYRFEAKKLHGGEIVMTEMSVTGTANAILVAAQIEEEVKIYNAASEHYIQDLCWFLEQAGVEIKGIGTHELSIRGTKKLSGTEYTIMPDPIETGTFVALGAATNSKITLKGVAIDFLRLEFQKFKEAKVNCSERKIRKAENNKYKLSDLVIESSNLKAVKKVNTMPYPGFTADLLPPFAVMLTQAKGTSLIHEWMFEGRQKYLNELMKMGANITICDPHRAVIVGPTPLNGTTITSFDIRTGATLVVAAIVAQGESQILNIEQIDRGYERIEERLRRIEVDIVRKEE